MTELERQLMESLEKLNLQYIDLMNSKEQHFAKNILKIKNDIKNFDFLSLFTVVRKKNAQKKIDRRYGKVDVNENLSESDRDAKLNHVDLTSKVAVYTCIVGDYDNLCDPIFKNSEFDFFVFSDKYIQSNIWTYKEILPKIRNLEDNTLINRYFKMHPFEMFPNYDYAIYIDGNVNIVSDISSLVHEADVESGFAMHHHVLRNCLYEEGDACILYGKGNSLKIKEQIKKYRHNGFPEHYGMLEATIIIFNLKNTRCKKIMNDWWNEFIQSGSKRDQIALPYVLWKNGIKISEVGFLGNNVYKNSKFQVLSH